MTQQVSRFLADARDYLSNATAARFPFDTLVMKLYARDRARQCVKLARILHRRNVRDGHQLTVSQENNMNEAEFRTVLNWWMASDPMPEGVNKEIINDWLDREAKTRGYADLIGAFHEAPHS